MRIPTSSASLKSTQASFQKSEQTGTQGGNESVTKLTGTHSWRFGLLRTAAFSGQIAKNAVLHPDDAHVKYLPAGEALSPKRPNCEVTIVEVEVGDIEFLKRRVRQLQILCSACLLLLVVVGLSGFALAKRDEVLRVRGLIIEDEQGHARILLGTPTPKVAERKRIDPVDGLVLLGPNGADRFVASYPGYEPQVQGKVGLRQYNSPSAGLMINDADGNERIGLGTSDDGTRSALGMDYTDRDALGLLVSPNFSGLAMFARNGPKNDQVTINISKDGTASAKLADSNGDEGIIAEVKQGAILKLQARNPKTSKLEEVSGKLFP